MTANLAGFMINSRQTMAHLAVHMRSVFLEGDDLVGVCHEFVQVVHPRKRARS
jgi:hypothetical protein